MNTHTKRYTMADAIKVIDIASSTNASPIQITTNGNHGLSTGDKVCINGHATNTNANGTFTITRVSATEFTLVGSTGNGVGGATGVVADFIKPIFVGSSRHLLVSIASDGGGVADATIKCVGAIIGNGGSEMNASSQPPDFADDRSADNHFEFIQMVDKQNTILGVSLPGDTGLVFSGDDYRLFEVNTNGLGWLSFLVTGGTQGQYTIKLMERVDR